VKDERRHAGVVDLLVEIYTYAMFFACATAFLPLVGLSHFRHRRELPRQPGRWVRRIGRVAPALTPVWKLSVEGSPPADIHERAYVVVANHLSVADPFLLSSLPWDMRWVCKEELMRPPIVGWILRLGGDIPLRRGEGHSVRAMLDQCRRTLDGRLSVMFFPQGTRSRESGVQPFKDGAFELAIERGAPVLPIAIAGTERCMRKGSPRINRARAIASILAPIETTGLSGADVPRIRDLARDQIAAAALELEARIARGG
jgi:1-acyl-sn-glycerol-3-phosphate acyltransferase